MFKIKILGLNFFLIFLSFCLSGCMTNSNNGSKENDLHSEGYIKYQINLKPSNSSNYEIIVPVLIEETGDISTSMLNLSVSGNGQFEIINTQYGKGLKITGIGKISINQKSTNDITIAWFSMISNETGGGNAKYWIFFNSSETNSISIYIHGEVVFGQKTYLSYISENINTTGWQEINGIKSIKYP